MNLIEILLLSMSLSVDTLVVSLGGSVSLGRISPGKVLKVSLAFGLMQAGLIFLGWLAGASVASFIHKANPKPAAGGICNQHRCICRGHLSCHGRDAS